MPKGLKNCFLCLNESNRKRLGVFVWVRGVCGEWLRGGARRGKSVARVEWLCCVVEGVWSVRCGVRGGKCVEVVWWSGARWNMMR